MKGKSVEIVKNRFAIASVIVGFVITVVSALYVSKNNQAYILDAAKSASTFHIDTALTRMNLYQYGLAGARGPLVVLGKDSITRESFKLYSETRDVDKEFPGARGFGYIERVLPSQELSFVEEAKKDGWSNFAIRELNPNEGERFVIKYIEPVDRNLSAVGLDIASEKNRREAAWKSILSGKAQLSGPITLVQATGNPKQSFLILMPLYENGVTPSTEEERKSRGYGWSYAPLIMEEILADQIINKNIEQFALKDVTDPTQPITFFDSDIKDPEQEVVLVVKQQHEIFGRIWESEYSIKPAFVDRMRLTPPNLVVFLGIIFTFLVASLVGAISQTRQNRLLVIQEQAKLASIVESTLDGIIGVSLKGTIISWNKGAKELFGYKRDEVLGKKLIDLIVTPLDKKDELDILKKVSEGEHISHFDAVRQRKDGSLVDVSIAVSPITNEYKKVIGSSVTCRDISVQKHNEQVILQVNDNLEHLVEERTSDLTAASNHLLMASEVAELGIWTWQIDTDKLTWNNQMYDIYGYAKHDVPDELVYEHWTSRLHPEDRDSTEQCLIGAVNNECEYDPVFRIILPDGRIRHIQAGAYIERDSHGVAKKVTGINRNITSQVELEAWLRHAKEKSDEASKEKSNFLANMSHEIRTPMNAVLGMLNLIQRTELTRRQLDYAVKATSAATSLLSLLNDILDYSKLDAGKLELDVHAFELESVMQELATILSGNQSDKPVEVLFDLPVDMPSTLIGDQLRLQQILTNLTSNAFKFTEAGHIILKVEELGRTDRTTTLHFSVTDTGIGIHPDQIDKIFNGFSQAEASIARRFGGSGLGLVISKTLIELMGGQLHVESEPGKGSVFSFTIKFDCESGSIEDQHKALLHQSLSVLIVDDSEIARNVLSNTAKVLGWNVSVASNAIQGLDLIRTCYQKDRYYDIIFLDWNMPTMSGMDMLEVLGKMDLGKPKPKVILVTAFSQVALSEVKNVQTVPISDIISKPATPVQVLNIVCNVMDNTNLSPESIIQPSPSEAKLEGLTILLVEDNALNRQVATELLIMEGANVSVAEGGIEGVEKVMEAGDSYDVVLMDMQMPDIDGLEATRRIRTDARFTNLPILAMTANVSALDIKACLEAGMNDHLGKPIEIQFVVEKILFWTHSQIKDPVEGARIEEIEENDIKTDSLQAILKRFSGNKTLFKKVMMTFEDDASALLMQLREANSVCDKEKVSSVLHTLRGASSTVGAISVVEKLKSFEVIMMRETRHGEVFFDKANLEDLEVLIQLSLFKLNSF
ncbi:CHASE domain-containing protein [Marinomonas algicola]|uniref:CHASE domain-containing protein n=1 Tax=Marinomonas algicola TaxID=2773454 RepID=UPI00174AE867|nr:CHASE domain-containing protein [Marinomonas algicola]